MNDRRDFEVIIIGGSYAGLSAAMALGRFLRDVLLIDSGLPCNRQTPRSHNFLTQDGVPPAMIGKRAKSQVLNYPTIKFLNDQAVSGAQNGKGFVITTRSNQEYSAQKLIFATGIKDMLPAINGFAQCWGISVIHCPYCHGYEYHHQKTGIWANGAKALHLASLVKHLSGHLTLLTSGKADFNAEQMATLNKYHIEIIESPIVEIEHQNGFLQNVLFEDGVKENFSALYAAIPFTQHCDIPASLGCEITDEGYLKIDNWQATTIPGVFACGDNTATMRSVASAVYTGNLTGAMVNKALIDERF